MTDDRVADAAAIFDDALADALLGCDQSQPRPRGSLEPRLDVALSIIRRLVSSWVLGEDGARPVEPKASTPIVSVQVEPMAAVEGVDCSDDVLDILRNLDRNVERLALVIEKRLAPIEVFVTHASPSVVGCSNPTVGDGPVAEVKEALGDRCRTGSPIQAAVGMTDTSRPGDPLPGPGCDAAGGHGVVPSAASDSLSPTTS